MSIPSLLKQAFKDRDWGLVNEAFKELTGNYVPDENEIEEKPKKRGRPKKVKIIVPTPEQVKEVEAVQEDPLAKFRIKVPDSQILAQGQDPDKNYGKIEDYKPTENKWKDDKRLELDSHKNFDKKVRNESNSSPVMRRPEVEYMNVNCVDCMEKFAILPHQLNLSKGDEESKSLYRCDTCWIRRKRN